MLVPSKSSNIWPDIDSPPTGESVSTAVNTLAALKYFPRETEARTAIGNLLLDLCATQGQLDWLIERLTDGTRFDEWPGPAAVRALFYERFQPADHRLLSEPEYYRPAPQLPPVPEAPLTDEERSWIETMNRKITVLAAKQKIKPVSAEHYEPPDWLVSCDPSIGARR